MIQAAIRFAFFALLLGAAVSNVEAGSARESRLLPAGMNALFLWAVDPTDVLFDIDTSDLSTLSGWNFDPDPFPDTAPVNGAWVLAAPGYSTGGGALSEGGTIIEIGFDYVVDNFFGASIFQYQYAFVLFNGAGAEIQASGARTLVRSALVNAGVEFGPPISAAQFDAIDSYFATMPAAASVPTPNSIVLLGSALAVLGTVTGAGAASMRPGGKDAA